MKKLYDYIEIEGHTVICSRCDRIRDKGCFSEDESRKMFAKIYAERLGERDETGSV